MPSSYGQLYLRPFIRSFKPIFCIFECIIHIVLFFADRYSFWRKFLEGWFWNLDLRFFFWQRFSESGWTENFCLFFHMRKIFRHTRIFLTKIKRVFTFFNKDLKMTRDKVIHQKRQELLMLHREVSSQLPTSSQLNHWDTFYKGLNGC